MIVAKHNQLLQKSNHQLVEIRQLELNYYSSFFSSFGTLCSLIAGFTLNSLTNMVLDGSEKQSKIRYYLILFDY